MERRPAARGERSQAPGGGGGHGAEAGLGQGRARVTGQRCLGRLFLGLRSNLCRVSEPEAPGKEFLIFF